MALGVWPSVFVGSRPFSSRNVNFSPLLFAFRLVICTGYERHVGLFPAPPSPPAFLYSKGARTSPITHTVFTPKSRRSLCSAGLKLTQYSGHSFCRGGATYAFLCGAPVELISPQGDWSSDALPLYIAIPLERCISMAYLIKQNIV